jgi:hypothetical protein
LESRQRELDYFLSETAEFESDAEHKISELKITAEIWRRRKRTAVNPQDICICNAVMERVEKDLKEAVEEKKEMKKELATETREKRKARKDAKAYLKKIDIQPVMDKEVRMRVEAEVLLPNGIERSSYHGGDFEGGQALNLLTKGGKVFSEMETNLLESDPDKRHSQCTDSMISAVCEAFGRLNQYYNILRYLARKRMGTATEDDMKLLDKCVGITCRLEKLLFGKLTPKMHSKKHLQEDFRKYRGLGMLGEDHMEQDHQFGKQDEKMTIGIRSRPKAFVIHQAFAERRTLVQMSGVREKMLKETSIKGKKRKVSTGDEGEMSMEEWTRYL